MCRCKYGAGRLKSPSPISHGPKFLIADRATLRQHRISAGWADHLGRAFNGI